MTHHDVLLCCLTLLASTALLCGALSTIASELAKLVKLLKDTPR